MPAVLDPDETSVDADSSPLTGDVPPEPQPTPQSGAMPPTTQSTASPPPPLPSWESIQKSAAFRSSTPEQGLTLFKSWVSQAQSLLDQSSAPKQAQQGFDQYIQSEASKNFGVSIPQDESGKPLTIGKMASLHGQNPQNLYSNQYDTPQTPFVIKQQAAPGDSLISGLTHLFSTPGEIASSAYDFVTNTEPGGTALDRGLEVMHQFQRNTSAENPGGLSGFLENTIPEGVGNLASMFVGGGGGALGKVGLKAVGGMAGFAAADSSEETYHNALNSGATPIQASESAGISAGITAGEFLAFGGISKLAAQSAFGANAENFIKGLYRPTVGEAAKYMALEAAGLGTMGASGQVAQNASDRKIYDPERELSEGVVQAATGMAFFSLLHLPSLLKSFAGNAARVQAAAVDHVNANRILAVALDSGYEKEIADAQASADQAQKNYADIIKSTAESAGSPTTGEIQDAKAYTSGEIPVPGSSDEAIAQKDDAAANALGQIPEEPKGSTQVLDGIISTTENEAIAPAELPVIGEEAPEPTISQPTESPVQPAQSQTAQAVGPLTTEEVTRQNGQNNIQDQRQAELGQPRPVLDQAELGEGAGSGHAGERGDNDSGQSGNVEAGDEHPPLASENDAQVSSEPQQEGGSGKPSAPSAEEASGMTPDEQEAHALGQTVTPHEQLAETPLARNARIDPKIDQLPKAIQKPTQDFIKAARKWGLRGVKNFIVDTRENAPVFVRTREGDFSTVYINPIILAREDSALRAKGYDQKQINYLHELRFSEEFEHNIGGRVIHDEWKRLGGKGDFSDYYDKKFASIYDAMTKKQRAALQSTYKGDLKDVDISKNSSEIGLDDASRFGEEFYRQTMQRKEGGTVTEDAITAIRNNKPMKSIVRGIVRKLQSMVEKLKADGHSDPVIESLINDRKRLLDEEASEIKPKKGKGKKISKSASIEPEDFDYTTPSENEEPAKPQEEEQGPNRFESKDNEWNKRLQAVKDIEIPNAIQQKLHSDVEKLSRFQFGADNANRDIGSANAFFKVSVLAREWMQKHGSLDGFGATRIIRNSLLDDGRKAARRQGESLGKSEELESKGGEMGDTEEPVAQKGIDLSENDNEANQSQFEGVVDSGNVEGVTETTPRAEVNNARVTANVSKVFEGTSSYEHRLMELHSDYPDTWARKAADEFGLSEPVIEKDFNDLQSRVQTRISQTGLGAHDFKRISSAASIDTPQFKKWFGDSKVVDDAGKPKIVYHGTAQSFDRFDPETKGNNTGAYSANKGYFFTDDPHVASNYSETGYRNNAFTSLYSGKELTLDEMKTLENLTSKGGLNIYESPFSEKRQHFPINRVSMHEVAKTVRKGMESGESFASAMSKHSSQEFAYAVDGYMDHHDAGQGSNVLPCYLSLQNPLIYDFGGSEYRETTYNRLLIKAKENGHDGAIFKNTVDDPGGIHTMPETDPNVENLARQQAEEQDNEWNHLSEAQQGEYYDSARSALGIPDSESEANAHDIYIAFEPTQIKSATGNNGNFDPSSPLISASASLNLPSKATVIDNLKKFADERTKLGKFTDWAKYINHYGTVLAQGIQRSNAAVREFRKLLPDRTVSGGVIRYIEAAGDRKTLESWAKQTAANPKTKHLAPFYEAALKLTPEQQAVAGKVSQLLEATRQLAKTWGIDIAKRDNYFPRTVDEGQGNLTGSGNSLSTTFKNAKERTHETMFDGEQAGVTYKTKDVAEGVGAYLNDLYRQVAAKKFIASLYQGKTESGEKMVEFPTSSFKEITNPPKGQVHLVSDGGPRQNMEHYVHVPEAYALKNWSFAGKLNGTTVLHMGDLWVHPEIARKIDRLFGSRDTLKAWWDSPSSSMTQALGKRVTKIFLNDINAIAKSNLFALSPIFHPIQIGAEALAHGNTPMARAAIIDALKFLPSKTIRGMQGIKTVDFTDPETAWWSDRGLVMHPEESLLSAEGHSQLDLTFLRTAEWVGEKLVAKAAGKGPLAEKSAQYIHDTAAYIKQANADAQNWIFQKYIPALKLYNAKTAFEANKLRFAKELKSGEYTLEQVAKQTADSINNAYGHLNYREMARSPVFQRMMNTVFLAPDFFEARQKHLGQAILGIFGNKAGRENFVAMARMGLALGVSAQVANFLANGETYWQDHPFEVKIGNRFYGFRTAVGDARNLFKDSWDIATWQGKGLPYVANRMSPLSRFIEESISGVNWRGEKIPALSAITDLIAGSTPMVGQGYLSEIPGMDKVFVSTKNNSISPFESALGALGVKVSRYSPIQDIKVKAHDWVAKNPEAAGIPAERANATYPVSAYRPLEYALDDGDFDAAFQEYQKLVNTKGYNAQKVDSGIQQSLNHSYTGSSKGDQAFVTQLDAGDKQLYQAAKDREKVLMVRYRQMLQEYRK